MSQNRFSRVMSKKSVEELEKVLESSGTYTDEAQLAAANELKNRGIKSGELEQIILNLSGKLHAKHEINKFEAKFTSKNSIYLWAFLTTPFLITPFLAFNIWELGNRKGVWPVIALGILYIPLVFIIFNILPFELKWLTTLVHLAYATFFVEWTWKKYLPTFEDYHDINNHNNSFNRTDLKKTKLK